MQKGVTDRIGENPEARLTLAGDTGGTQGGQFLLSLAGIAHADVEVQLLRIRRVRPARRNPLTGPLKGQLPQAGPGTNDHPAIDILIDPMPSTWQ